jgi:DNA-binding NtrC family response regulator
MRTILFLCDQPDVHNFMAAFLRRNDFFVQEATPRTAIDLLKKNSFDVIIADLYLPQSSAIIEVLAYHYRVAPERPRILFSLFESDNIVHVCQIINTVFITKPVPLKQIILTIGSFERSSRLMPYK